MNKQCTPTMEPSEQFAEMMERHKYLIRRLCVRYSEGDEQLCRDLMQEVAVGMWLRYSEREWKVWGGAQRAWVYWQTRHFASHAVRDWHLREREALLPEAADGEVQAARESLVDELAVELQGRERQMLELLRQGYRYEEIAERMGVSMRTVKRLRASMVEAMRQRAEAMGMMEGKG